MWQAPVAVVSLGACAALLFTLPASRRTLGSVAGGGAFAGLAYSLFPYLVIDRIVYTEAAAAPGSLKIILAGAAVTLPMIVGYTVFAYRVFWGRSTELSYE